MSYEKIDILGKNIKMNTVAACGLLLAATGAAVNINKYAEQHRGEPIVKVVPASQAQEDDPNAVATLFFGSVAALCAGGLARKKGPNDNSPAMQRFMDNMRDGLRR